MKARPSPWLQSVMSGLQSKPFVFDFDPTGDDKLAVFDGGTFVPALDGERLTRQLDRVRALMADGTWRTLAEIGAHVAGSEASLSARLRDLRKEGLTVERERRGDPSSGLFHYRVVTR